MIGLIGIKEGQISVFDKEGNYFSTSIIKVYDNFVIDKQTKERNSYESVKLASVPAKLKSLNHATIQKYKKLKIEPQKYEHEFKNFLFETKIGDKLNINSFFNLKSIVQVTGITKGKGTQGSIKRHNFAIGPKSHGSHFHRSSGSLGSIEKNRTFKNKKMPGRSGCKKVTVKNLQVVYIGENNDYLLIKGAIPGPKKGVVFIQEMKQTKNKNINIIELFFNNKNTNDKNAKSKSESFEETKDKNNTHNLKEAGKNVVSSKNQNSKL